MSNNSKQVKVIKLKSRNKLLARHKVRVLQQMIYKGANTVKSPASVKEMGDQVHCHLLEYIAQWIQGL